MMNAPAGVELRLPDEKQVDLEMKTTSISKAAGDTTVRGFSFIPCDVNLHSLLMTHCGKLPNSAAALLLIDCGSNNQAVCMFP